MPPNFGDLLSQEPVGYTKRLIKTILTTMPELADDMVGLMREVNRLKNYEVRASTAEKYARLFKAGRL